MKYLHVPLWLLVSGVLLGQNREAYIDRYQYIAVSEMHRCGIPASIKLAQAILESNAGGSDLARDANNHFGIKCGGEWKGSTYHKKDDDRNVHGHLVKSCFRVFNTPEECFVAHSEFLRDPNKMHRYGFLFDLRPDDYRNWARGLKKAGYATNPRYPALLIQIIEEYDLHRFDQMSTADLAQAGWQPAQGGIAAYTGAEELRSYPTQYVNTVPYVVSYEGDTPAELAMRTRTPVQRIIRFNETINHDRQTIPQDVRVFLRNKKTKWKGSQKYHLVKAGQTIAAIAQLYGMRESSLYKRNGIPTDRQPAIGQRIVLKGKSKHEIKLRPINGSVNGSSNTIASSGMLDAITPVIYKQPTKTPDEPGTGEYSSGTVSTEKNSTETITDSTTTAVPSLSSSFEQEIAHYVVQPKDTLFRIAQSHGITVEALKKLNNLSGDVIRPGQRLKLVD